jgi:hypothetical protein
METYLRATEAHPVAVEAHTGADEAQNGAYIGFYSSGSRHFNEESNSVQHRSERSDRIRICIKVKTQNQNWIPFKKKSRIRIRTASTVCYVVIWVRNTRQTTSVQYQRNPGRIKGLLVQFYYEFILQSSGFFRRTFFSLPQKVLNDL